MDSVAQPVEKYLCPLGIHMSKGIVRQFQITGGESAHLAVCTENVQRYLWVVGVYT